MRKLLLPALLLLNMVSFGQELNYVRVTITHSTANINGIEDVGNFGKYEIGGGLMTNGEKFRLYGIATKNITNEFSLGAKFGGLRDSERNQKGFQVYYGLVSYLQVFGK